MLRPEPLEPGAGIAKPVVSVKKTGPICPALDFKEASGSVPEVSAARELVAAEYTAVLTPEVTENGSPDMTVLRP